MGQLQHQVHHQPQNAMVSCLISPPLHATTKVVQNLNQEARTAKFAVKDATCTRIQAKEPSASRTRWMSRWLEQFFFLRVSHRPHLEGDAHKPWISQCWA